MIEASLTVSPTCNAALEQCGVPIVSAVRLVNRGAEPRVGGRLRVLLGPDLGEPFEVALPTLHGGEALDLGPLDLRLPAGRLRSLVEAEPGQLQWWVRGPDEALWAEGSAPISLLAYNEWPGLRAPPALLAAFVLPNHPALQPLLVEVRDRLAAATGDAAIDGYQSRSTARARAQVEALYGAVQGLGLSYVGAPASFEGVGQKVRLPDRLLADQMGNCLDLTLLFAAVAEQMRLAPLLVVVLGHAFPGVWLEDDRFPEGTVDDAARLRNLIELGQIVVFDSSTAIAAGQPSFAQAAAAARAYLAEDARFVCAIDVRVARIDRFRPLALRAAVAEGGPEGAGPLPIAEGAPPELLPSAPPPSEPVALRFKRWKDRLLDLSLRNRLLNFRPTAAGSLPLRVPDLARLENLLAGDTVFEIHPAPATDPRDQRDAALLAARTDTADLLARLRADLDRGLLQVDLSPADFKRRAVDLDRAARADLEEGGANTLFAAVGLLRWFESAEAKEPRYAPLLLVPVRLEYDRRGQRIRLRRTEGEPIGNVTLAEKLGRDFALDLSFLGQLGGDERGVDVAALLQSTRAAISRVPRWEVCEEVHLGLFTFTRFLMWKDLEDNAAALLTNEVVRHIAAGGADPFPDPVGPVDPTTLDATVPPESLPTVVDCDSTQMTAVVAARRGRSFVLQGPPGTGKSQTITNLIAAALHAGQTVLFVSEKMAALDVVHRRLSGVGLGESCLELHSHKANKAAVLRSLGAAWSLPARPGMSGWMERGRELAALRAELNAYAQALHAPRPIGRSLHALTGRLSALSSAPELALSLREPAALTEEGLRSRLEAAAALATAAGSVLPLSTHPFARCGGFPWTHRVEQRLIEALAEARTAARGLGEASAALAHRLGAAAPDTIEAMEALATLGAALSPLPPQAASPAWPELAARAAAFQARQEALDAERAALDTRWSLTVYSPALTALAPTFARWASAFFLLAFFLLFFPRRSVAGAAKGRLPDDRLIAEDLQRAKAVTEAEPALRAEQAALQALFAGAWPGGDKAGLAELLARAERLRGAQGPVASQLPRLIDPAGPAELRARAQAEAAALSAALTRLRAARAAVEEGLGLRWGDDHDPGLLGRIEAESKAWTEARPRLRAYCLFQEAATVAASVELGALVEALRQGSLRPADAVPAVEKALLGAINLALRDEDPLLRSFDAEAQERRVERFRALDREHVQRSRAEVLRALDERRLSVAKAEVGEPGLLARELRKQRGHMPIRKLLAGIPNLLPRLKPCLLMSPLSVAQYLPADGRRFDLVVFDEASQIGTHDAIGAIARGNQVVIVGDSKQLPPTAFFQREGAPADALPDENDIIELESILDEALAARLPEQMLGWHYRSRHESLIDFSNQHSYEGRLNIFPAAAGRSAELGLRFTAVPEGVYDKGKTRANRKEAEALVAHLVTRLEQTAPGARSFGVVTFSQAQQTLVADLLDQARARRPAIEPHFADSVSEPVFVKNLENVQGDERDVILFSIGYGPDEQGKVWMNFGPLNRSGGERRLNVAVTRARQENHVFSTLTADQIDLSRTRAKGAAHLKAFLQQAASRAAALSTLRTADYASPLEGALHDQLVADGHTVDCRVGCGAYRIDLAVLDPKAPEAYLLGVEGDGPAYAQAATARDRDRLRGEVLANLGWRLFRAWSTEQWLDPARAAARLAAAVEASRSAPPPAPPPLPPPPPPVAEATLESAAPPAPAPALPRAPAWQRAQLPERADKETFFEPRALRILVEQVGAVAAVEAPISLTELSRRVAGAWGHKRLTEKVRRRVLDAVEAAEQARQGTRRGDFYWRLDQDPDALTLARGPAEDGEARDADDIAEEELAAGALIVLRGLLSAPQADLLRELSRHLGLGAVGARLRARLELGIDRLVAQGRALREGDRVALQPGA